jgi:hypothetical protein
MVDALLAQLGKIVPDYILPDRVISVVGVRAAMGEVEGAGLVGTSEQHQRVCLIGGNPEERRIVLKCVGCGSKSFAGTTVEDQPIGETAEVAPKVEEVRLPGRVRGIKVREAARDGECGTEFVERCVKFSQRS